MRRVLTVIVAALAAVASTAVLANAGGWRGDDRDEPQLSVGDLGVPDVVLYDGKISTVDKRNSTVEAIAIRDGEVMATGSSRSVKKLAQRGTRLVDLDGRRVLPGPRRRPSARHARGLPLLDAGRAVRPRDQACDHVAMLKAKADQLPDGRWIWANGGGWNINQLDNPTPFTFDELTAVAPRNPVWVAGAAAGGGTGMTGPRVNQAALDALGLAPGSPGVQLGPDGKPTSVISGAASTLVNAAIRAHFDTLGIDGEAKCLEDFIKEANSRGLTGWKDAGGNQAPFGTTGAINDGLRVEEGAMHLYRTKGLNARIAYNAMSGYAGFPRQLEDTRNAVGFLGDDMFRYLGPGEDMMPDDPDYNDFTRHSAAKRLSVETHIGALDPLLDGFEAANEVYDIGELKWKIAHPNAGQPTDEQIARADALNVGWALTTLPVRNGGPGPRYRTVMEKADHMCRVGRHERLAVGPVPAHVVHHLGQHDDPGRGGCAARAAPQPHRDAAPRDGGVRLVPRPGGARRLAPTGLAR